MRIISGTNRGAKLFTLEGTNTRPTLDRVKEPLFSIIQEYIPESNVLDLFAGSGALGLECISRGANSAILCDSSRDAISIINQNVNKLKMDNCVQVINLSYEQFLQKALSQNLKFDIVFLDPPYQTDYAEKACRFIFENDLLSQDGIIIIETDNRSKVLQNLQEISNRVYNEKSYGRVTLFFLR